MLLTSKSQKMPNQTNTRGCQTHAMTGKKFGKIPNHQRNTATDDASRKCLALTCSHKQKHEFTEQCLWRLCMGNSGFVWDTHVLRTIENIWLNLDSQLELKSGPLKHITLSFSRCPFHIWRFKCGAKSVNTLRRAANKLYSMTDKHRRSVVLHLVMLNRFGNCRTLPQDFACDLHTNFHCLIFYS